MKNFEKLSREEMKSVMGGYTTPPACIVGALCNAYGPAPGGHGTIVYQGTCNSVCACVSTDGTGSCSNS